MQQACERLKSVVAVEVEEVKLLVGSGLALGVLLVEKPLRAVESAGVVIASG